MVFVGGCRGEIFNDWQAITQAGWSSAWAHLGLALVGRSLDMVAELPVREHLVAVDELILLGGK